MSKKTYFYIDDVIWVMRDLTRQRPASMFDNPFLKVLKEAHDKYGMKVQLNLFYRTDFYYGNDEFTLADMTDAYKAEWEASSDWLHLGFHSKQEFPDYPFINATYEDVKAIFEDIKREVDRFAGDQSFGRSLVPHWLPISKEGVRALKDCGIKIISMSSGDRREYNGDPFSLPYGHAGRLLQNRQPETMIYNRGTKDVAIDNSLCGYNHFPVEIVKDNKYTQKFIYDSEMDICFKQLGGGPCLNLETLDEPEKDFAPLLDSEYLGYGTHEQYFYEDYYAYQPDYPAKILKAAEILSKAGYTYFWTEELVK